MFLKELKKLIGNLASKTQYIVALNVVTVMIPLFFYKSLQSRQKSVITYLEKKDFLWKDGEILKILREYKEISIETCICQDKRFSR